MYVCMYVEWGACKQMFHSLENLFFEGLLRCGKSCRLRWINYLRTDLKRGNISPEEEDLIVKLHASLGNRLVGNVFDNDGFWTIIVSSFV